MPNLFPISLEVEEVAVGRVLRRLSGMSGVARVHLNLQNKQPSISQDEDDDVRGPVVEHRSRPALIGNDGLKDGRTQGRAAPQKNECYRAIASVLMKAPAHYKVLAAAVERAGYKTSAIAGLLRRMQELNLASRISPGTYRITPKGERMFGGGATALPKPVARRKVGAGTGYKKVNNFTGTRKIILEALAKKPLLTAELVKILEDADYSSKNAGTTGMKMRNEGLIEFSDGRFSITDAGREVLSHPPEPDDHSPVDEDEGLDTHA